MNANKIVATRAYNFTEFKDLIPKFKINDALITDGIEDFPISKK